MKLLKAMVIPVLVLCLVLGIALPALASSTTVTTQSVASFKPDDEKDKKGKMEVVTGNVTAINGSIITVNGKEIATDNQTRYKIPGDKDPAFADIQVGMRVIAQSRVVDGKLTARQIVVAPKPPIPFVHTGNVTAFAYSETTGGSITILEKAGTSLTFTIVAGKFTVRPQGAVVSVGEMVTVTGRRDPAGGTPIATAVAVLPHPLQQVTGTINNITQTTTDNGTITIATTVLNFDKNTVLVIKGALGARVGQEATAAYREQVDHSRLAKRIWIGMKPPEPKPPKPLPTAAAVKPQKANKFD